MEKSLPTIHWYPLSPELIRKLDEIYGKEQWRIMNWEGTQHLVHIPEMYVNRIDYVPILCLKDGTQARPFTEHSEAFPTSILPHSVLSASEFANIIHRKFALGIPLYRQEKDLQQMCGIHLGRQDMAKWIICAGTRGFTQVYDYLIRQERACEYHNIDETFLQVILDGRSAATKSYLWAHRTGELANPEHPVLRADAGNGTSAEVFPGRNRCRNLLRPLRCLRNAGRRAKEHPYCFVLDACEAPFLLRV